MVLGVFHAGNRGSNPLGDAINKNKGLSDFDGPFVFLIFAFSNPISNLQAQLTAI